MGQKSQSVTTDKIWQTVPDTCSGDWESSVVSKHTGTKQNITQNNDSKSFKVTYLDSVERQ